MSSYLNHLECNLGRPLPQLTAAQMACVLVRRQVLEHELRKAAIQRHHAGILGRQDLSELVAVHLKAHCQDLATPFRLLSHFGRDVVAELWEVLINSHVLSVSRDETKELGQGPKADSVVAPIDFGDLAIHGLQLRSVLVDYIIIYSNCATVKN